MGVTIPMRPAVGRKYGNKPTVVDGFRFDSKAEAKRWGELQILERAGIITELKRQVSYELTVNDRKIGSYRADFVYSDVERCVEVVEDVKGVRTPLYNWKRKHFAAQYGREITEVAAR